MRGLGRLVLAACVMAMVGACAQSGSSSPANAAPSAAAPAAAADAAYSRPYIDVDEWRDAPVRHRYVHGGFEGSQARFSFYFPPAEQYEGRFFQHFMPVPSSENLAQLMPAGPYNKIGFSISSGGYFVETNAGDFPTNAAIAQYSRTVALEMYGGARPYGYAYGGSGGGYRTIGAAENTRGVWDGVVPYVIGSTMAIPNMFTVRMRAMRILGDKFVQIVDAVEPGGGGDIYAGLNPLEAEALREVTRMGFPTPSWYGYKTMGIHGFAALYQGVVMADPTYFTDFWTKPGYLGHDHPEQFADARMQYESAVAAPITGLEAARLRLNTDASSEVNRGGVDNAFRLPEGEAAERVVAFRLRGAPPDIRFLGGDLVVLSGAASGKTLPLARIVGDIVVLGMGDPSVAAQLAPGDRVRVDNSNFLAIETYHRHQVPGPDFPVWDQFRDAEGRPLYPQRPTLIGPLFVQMTAGSQLTGQYEGKMIVVASLWDREAMPWQADWYRQRVRQSLGAEAETNFRLWYTDRALHGDEPFQENATRVVGYEGMLHQALRDVAAWAENGTPPLASTNYTIEDGAVIVPDTARERRGIQPVVTLRVNGAERADVRVGQPVTLTARIEVPPGAGSIIDAQWDFDGSGAFATRSQVRRGARNADLTMTHAFTAPGTYFPVIRATSQRDGDRDTPYGRLYNLGRVRVVVE